MENKLLVNIVILILSWQICLFSKTINSAGIDVRDVFHSQQEQNQLKQRFHGWEDKLLEKKRILVMVETIYIYSPYTRPTHTHHTHTHTHIHMRARTPPPHT